MSKSKTEELYDYLKDRGLILGGLFFNPGYPVATTDEIAEELLAAMKRVEEGDYEVVYDSDYPTDSSWEELDD